MVLQTKIGGSLPKGAVAVSREEALQYQKEFIQSWPSEMDVLFLKYGGFMTAATTFVSSHMILKFFKDCFNLRFSPAVQFSYIASGVFPSIFSVIFTEKFLTDNVLLMKKECPVCDELKFGASQLYASVAYPAIFGYFTFASRAQIQNTYPIPNIKTHPREFWSETFRIFKSTKVFQIVALGQSVWILFLPYMQNKQLYNVMNKAKENVVNEDWDNFNKSESNLY